MEAKFKVGDWVNIPSDAKRGNYAPGRVDRLTDDGGLMVRWSNDFGLGYNAWAWEPGELVLVDAPKNFADAT